MCTSCPSPRITHFFKESWFLFLKNSIRYWDLASRCTPCYWGSLLLDSEWRWWWFWMKSKNRQVTQNPTGRTFQPLWGHLGFSLPLHHLVHQLSDSPIESILTLTLAASSILMMWPELHHGSSEPHSVVATWLVSYILLDHFSSSGSFPLSSR